MYEKLKSFIADDTFFTAILMLLVGVVSFGLGRQSVEEVAGAQSFNQPAGVVFIQPKNSVEIAGEEESGAIVAQVVVSKSGTKYHLLTCSGAKTIKEENKVYFESSAKAKAAGYMPAANCEGLE